MVLVCPYQPSFQQLRVLKLPLFWKSVVVTVLGTFHSLYFIRLWELTMCQKYNSCEPYDIFHLTKHIFLSFWTHEKSNKSGIHKVTLNQLCKVGCVGPHYHWEDAPHFKWLLYGGYFEMPEKACERWFCHVIAFAHFFRNARKSKNFIFGFFSVLKLITCIFFEMPDFLTI